MSSNSALLVIDMQVALVTGSHREPEVLNAINTVIQSARNVGAPVVFVQHNHNAFEPLMKGSEGWKIHPILARDAQDLVIEKEASDAFYETTLEDELKQMGVTTVVICGMQTEFCVDATCRAALSRNLDVLLVADGHTTGPSHLPAAEIVDHHNAVLPNLAHPKSSLSVVPSGEIVFLDSNS